MFKKITYILAVLCFLPACLFTPERDPELNYSLHSIHIADSDVELNILLERPDLSLKQPASTDLNDVNLLDKSLQPEKMLLLDDKGNPVSDCELTVIPHKCVITDYIKNRDDVNRLSKYTLDVRFKDKAEVQTDLVVPYLTPLETPQILWPGEIPGSAEETELPTPTEEEGTTIEEDVIMSPEELVLSGLDEEDTNVFVFKGIAVNNYKVGVQLCFIDDTTPCLEEKTFNILPSGDDFQLQENYEFYAADLMYRNNIFKLTFDFDPEYYEKALYTLTAMDDQRPTSVFRTTRSSSITVEVEL
ncbi:hypothetical protein GF354_03380 [Candidatus Peregrinibacteria bacterium]|nr:hypothetical protein [Candidatus Peregrinibacteria bacterium]